VKRFREIFPQPRPLIGMIALPPLPGYPDFHSIDRLVERALRDLAALEQGGADGALIENDFDQPHTLTGSAAVIAAMTRAACEVVAQARIPVGVQVLLNDWRASLAIAAAAGARFVRLDFFVDRVRIGAGLIEPDPAAVLEYRRAIRAESIALLTDIQVKYSTPADGPKPIEASALEAAAAGSDALIVTGAATGVGPLPADLRAAAGAGLPVVIGSGLSAANAAALLPLADGAIVGTALRGGAHWSDCVDPARVAALVRCFREPG
jgi:membrane complex biogenesis BtpA family protein